MPETTVRKKGVPKELRYLADLVKMFIRQGENLRIVNQDKTWDALCQKASGNTFSYEYIQEGHEIKITDILRDKNLSIPLEKYQ